MLCSLSLCIHNSSCSSRSDPPASPPHDLVTHLHTLNDSSIDEKIAKQQHNRTQSGHGGIRGAHGIYHAGSTASFIRDLAVAYTSAQSRYAGDPKLLAALNNAAEFMLDVQHADGTIDLLTTNFHSPPDTGFILEWMCASAGVLRDANNSSVTTLLDKLLKFIRLGADALTVGGVHTPNHRWVVCMALARANSLIPDPRYVKRIDTWLAENIDIDPDGQFTERSTSIYSPLTDRCLITIARLLNRPELLEPVRRNLEMSLHYMHANGDVVTEGSRRQDQYERKSMVRYYYPYRFMAQHDRNGRFASVVHLLEQSKMAQLSSQLVYFLESPSLADPLPTRSDLPSDFERHFTHSRLARIRRGQLSATILEDNPSFFSFHVGSAAVVLRFASAFFGKGQFMGSHLHKEGDAWVMSQNLTGPYFQPIAKAHQRADGNWDKMPRELRSTSEVQTLRSIVRITERPRGIDVEIDISGTDNVPIAIEIGCPPGSQVTGANQLTTTPASWSLTSGQTRVSVGPDHLEIGKGRADHRWTRIRGALPELPGDKIYVTSFSPFRDTLTFRW
ncbi:MAG: hypothetical protein VX951_01975 [Planctomycetota bacterium]|nr:hypothetical protein [Planctomycetota bacterium]